MSPPGVGCSLFFNAAVDESPVVDVALTRTLVTYLHIVNLNTTDVYLQMFNTAAANVTLGTTTPTLSFLIPGGTGASNVGLLSQQFSIPLQFNTALSIAVATSATGSGAPSSDAVVNIGYLAG